jgi:uncharacterized protein
MSVPQTPTPGSMILEGIVTSRNDDGSINVAPMGPIVDDSMSWLRLRPFQTSATFHNLRRHRAGVFHVVDDVLLLARAAIGKLTEAPETRPAVNIDGAVLVDACRWYEFEVATVDDSQERAEVVANVVHVGRIRDFFGFNRAKHAVLEASILATRVHLVSPAEIRAELTRLRSPVTKTAGPREAEAFELVEHYIEECLSDLV